MIDRQLEVCGILATMTVTLYLVLESSGWTFPVRILGEDGRKPFSRDTPLRYMDPILNTQLKPA